MKFRLDETRKFGIEIELTLPHRSATLASRLGAVGIDCYVEGYNHRTRDYWKITSDATVHGGDGYSPMELVSPPLQGRDGLAQLETVCAVLAELDAKVNRSCGLHIHHDANDLDIEAWKLVAKCYVKHENTIDQLMAPSRRGNGNQWARSLRNSYIGNTVAEVFARIDACNDNWSIQNVFRTRYVKLNLEASAVHGTIEFRQHHGTTNFAKIAAWTCLTQGFVTRSVAHKPVMLRTSDKPFDSFMWQVDAPAALRRYFWTRYLRNGVVEGDASDAVPILNGEIARQTRGPNSRTAAQRAEEASVVPQDRCVAQTAPVFDIEASTGQVRIVVSPVTGFSGATYTISTGTSNVAGEVWTQLADSARFTTDQMVRLYELLEEAQVVS